MSTSYESVCEELDSIALTYLTKLNEYTHQWKDTSNEFQQAYLDLAHAKYTMGARTISHYSYDERMKASLQVELEEDSDQLVLKKVEPSQKPQEKDSNKTDKEGLRKRHEPPKRKNSDWVQIDEKSSLSSDNDEIELDEKKNKKIKKNGDPLYWFGLFVSPSLRSSQTHFKTAAEQLIHQVNRINELKSLEKRYQELQEEKIILQLKKTKIQEIGRAHV